MVWGQCSRLLQIKLKANPKFDDMDNNSNVAVLLTEIKPLSKKTDENTLMYDGLHEAKAKWFRYPQSDDETLADHMWNFKDLCNGVDYHNGEVFFDRGMVQAEKKEDSDNNIVEASVEEYRARVINKAKAVAFINIADRKMYCKLLPIIREQHSFKISVYPKTLMDVFHLIH